MHAKWIHPEMIELFRISRRDVPGDAFVESEFREEPESGSQPLLAVFAFFGRRGELRRSGDPCCVLSGLGHKNSPVFRKVLSLILV
jgi:hypothetical protein